MVPLLFIAPCPLKISKTPSRTCLRRPRTVACASKDDDQPREIGEPSWMNLSRDISPTGSDDTPRPPPKWVYPEGQISTPEDNKDNPWKAWNAAVENEAPLEERDIKAETDFWRSAAKEIANDEQTSPSIQSNEPFPPLNDDILTDEPTNSSDVWRMARGVTGEMSELQEKLRSELERYNPDENTDQYRDIARELVGPPEEPWENSDPIRTSRADAEPGTGWNPDVDWMRFDDLRREQVKKAEQADRMEAQRVAREQMASFGGENQQEYPGIDDELTKTYTDQSVDETFIAETPAERLPGFLTNRMRRSGTYGGSWTGAEEEARKLQDQGIPLRDPRADADKWRSVARELSLEDKGDSAEDTGKDGEISPENEDVQPEDETDIEEMTTELKKTTFPAESAQTVKESSAIEEGSSWSSWRSGSAKWEAANEKLQERDPAAEVDMWRSSAREFASGTPAAESSLSKAETEFDMAEKDKTPNNEGSAWDQWRSANAQWESSISGANEETRPTNNTKWSSPTESDWGVGLGSKTVSERSAWQQWNNVSEMGKTSGSSLWWETRLDSSFENKDKPDRSFNNADEWRSVAREALNLPEKEGDRKPVSREERIETDCTLGSWRSIAKDLIENQD